MDEEEIKIKMDEGICLFVGGAALSRGPRMR